MDLNTTENKTIVDEKKELYNGIASILKSILQDISPIKCHDVDYDSYLKQEVYTHLQDTIDYEVFEEYYENKNYYLKIADHNNLSSFRKLKEGSTLEFPPIIS